MPARKLSYANVVATLALVIAVGGGSAYATHHITARDIAAGAVTTTKIKKRAVTSGKIAVGAVRGSEIADGSLSSNEIQPASIKPSSLAFPLAFAASPSGDSAALPGGEAASYNLQGATWNQVPGEINVIFGEANATLASAGSGDCQAYVQLSLNGRVVGGGELRTGSEAPTAVQTSLGANPEIDPLSARTNILTALIGTNGNCAPGSTIDSTRFRVLSFG